MNAEQLLEHFHLLGDAPDTVLRLRKLVVVLAIAGKLTLAEQENASASTILNEIGAERKRLLRTGVNGIQKSLPLIELDELPGGFSNIAVFARLGTIARIEKGPTGIQGAQSGPYPLVVTAEARSSCDHFDFEGSAAIIPLVSSTGHGKASLHRLHYQEGKFALGSILAAIFPFVPNLVSARFLYEYLSAFKEELLVSRMMGTANVALSIGKVAEVPVPIVSPAVQRRVDELMVLCDQLEQARAEREARRDRLAAATLVRLGQPAVDPREFREHAAFALEHLAAITARPDQIKGLRQTILNLAVRGKLVAQDPNDEPIKIALAAADRRRKEIARKDRRADAEAQELLAGEARWPVPDHWLWRGLADLVLFVDYRGNTPPKTADGVRLITAKNVRPGFISLEPQEFVSKQTYHTWMTRGFPASGDILFTTEAPMGNAAVVNLTEDFALAQRLICFQPYGAVNSDFLTLQLLSEPFQAILELTATGLTAKGIKAAKLKRLPITLPPLAEQRRIIAKVDALMALCDRLEAILAAGDGARRRLLDAVLSAALEPIQSADLSVSAILT
jgi:type I restriction enzyme, S subunit